MASCWALLLRYLDPGQTPLVFGLDETIERRWGPQIRARGIYRDAVRSSDSHFVKASGLRWLSLMWLTPIPWAQRLWALPVLTVLAPSERYYAQAVRRPKKLTAEVPGTPDDQTTAALAAQAYAGRRS